MLLRPRTQAVRDFLVGAGVDSGRLTLTGFGEGSPIASNDSEDDRALNRRVELLTQHWEPLTDQLPSLSITALAFDASDATGQTLYAGTGSSSSSAIGGQEIGLLKSVNGGDTWALINPAEFQAKTVHEIVVTPGGVLLVATEGSATSGGLFRSADGGLSFQKIAGNASDGLDNDGDTLIDGADPDENTGLPGGGVTGLVVDPADGTRIFAGSPGQGVFVSSDAGLTWTAVNAGIPTAKEAASILIEFSTSASADIGSGNHPIYAALIEVTRDTTNAAGSSGSGRVAGRGWYFAPGRGHHHHIGRSQLRAPSHQ